MRFVCVDNFPLSRQGLIRILKSEDGLEFVGEAASVNEARDVIVKLCPDIVIFDLRLKDESGLDILMEMRKLNTSCKYMVLTSSHEPEDFIRANELGIDGYILKDAMPEEILNAVRSVARGRKYYDPEVIEWVLKIQNQYVEQLTSREQEVLTAIGAGLSNKDISERLFITEYTVRKHVSRILAKLGLHRRTQAALYARPHKNS
ncbi:response regulator [Desulfosporosinus youngiae]|uniref:Stage 0 sporulation protein A homolog n=1 Tax=Desulfosporosinus youngiae DSM 17734 TaxID=768710 RepID=H5XUC8_9FIRM|nr:response regulator transcription factor [Desulfosporosinus youngiae]EHQ89364.1 response regulator containing a CheY-like receiver domain and an HTH DNA-binding domain [Desulfosporosinus youngiae DSM 17734]